MKVNVNLSGLLFLVLLVLKLTGVIDWSWWWVTAPLYGGLAIAAIAGVLAGIVATFLSLIQLCTPKRKNRF